MADNLTLNAGSGGSTLRTDDDGTAHWQYIKLAFGADNTQTICSATNPLPVDVDTNTIGLMLGTDFSSVLGSSSLVATDGSAALTIGTQILGTDGTNAQIISTNATGHVNIADGGNIITVDGTVTANAGTGTMTVDGSGVTQPVSGTVTANAGTGTMTVDGSGVTQPVSAASLPLPTGAASAANQTSVIGTDGNAGPTSVLSVGGTESGGNIQELRVDSDGHLQIDVLSGGGGGTQYTEDDAGAANPVGTNPVFIRQDTPATLVTTDGDVVAGRATNYGAQFVQILDSSGNFINTFGGSGGTSATDDGAFTAGSGAGTPTMGFVSTDVVQDGDVGVLAMDTSRRLFVSLEVDNAGLATEAGGIATVAGAVDGTEMQVDLVSVTPDLMLGTDFSAVLGAASMVATDGSAALTIGTHALGTDGTNAQIISTNSTGHVNIADGGNSITIDGTVTANAGTGTLAVSAATLPLPVGAAIETGGNLATIAGAVAAGQMQVDVVAALPAGTAAIGKLAANSGVDIGDVDVLSAPARDRTTDNMGIAIDSEVLANDTTMATVKYANLDSVTSGDNALVAAVAGKTIKVVSVSIFPTSTVDVYFNDGTANLLGGTRVIKLDATGAAGAGGFVLGHNPQGWFQTAADNRPLNVNLSSTNGACGCISYIEV